MSKSNNNGFLFQPHPGSQTDFLGCSADRIFFGGARGGAKTASLVIKSACNVIDYHYLLKGKRITPDDYEKLTYDQKKFAAFVPTSIAIDHSDYVAVLLRRLWPDIIKNLKLECDKFYPALGGKWREKTHCWIFDSGAKIFLNQCHDTTALRTFMSGNYHFIGIDQAEQFPYEWISQIEGSLRSSVGKFHTQLCLTGNPGDIGHKALKENYVDKCPPINIGEKVYDEKFDVYWQPQKSGKTIYDDNGIATKFIPSKVFDNPSITDNDPKYVLRLKSMNELLRAMWLEGRWDVFTGLYFDNWNIMHHVIPQEDFTYGKHFNKYDFDICRFYDYGTKNPFVCLFAAIDKNNRMTIFDEIHEIGMSATQQARMVMEYSESKYGIKPEDVKYEVADPAYWTKTSSGEDLISPAQFYEQEGIFLIPGNNDREAGAKVVYECLNVYFDDKGVPYSRIRFTDNCSNCISSIPSLPADPMYPEKVNTKADDHDFDALRYGAMETLYMIITKSKAITGWRERMKQNAINRQYQMQERPTSSRKGWMYK